VPEFGKDLSEHVLRSSHYGKISKDFKGDRIKDYLLFTEIQVATGDADAQNNLATMYADGDVVPKDYGKALNLFQSAAAQESPEALFNLGVMHELGRGIPVNYTQAFVLYRNAAEHGQEQAMLNVASMFATGRGVSANQAEAIKWVRRCAELGSQKAQALLDELSRRKRLIT
jgi:TPR repeat protein